jgi:ankyrin repeat protein
VAASTNDFFAAIAAGDVGTVESLLRTYPALASSHNADGVSAVLWACYTRQDEILLLLRRAGAELDLFDAVAAGAYVRVSALLEADPSLARAWSPDGYTALHLAAFFSQPAAAARLLALGADPSAVSRNSMGVTPLHSAAASGCHSICRLLLEQGASVDARQRGGYTALMAAGSSGDAVLATLLLSQGANPAAANDEGRTAADLARAKGHEEMAVWLRPRASARRAHP